MPVSISQLPSEAVILGGTLSLSGRFADVGKRMEQAYRLWESDISAKGGILGREIRIVILDDKSDPEFSARLYEDLISKDKVDLVISPYGSEIVDVMASVTERHEYPLVAVALAPEIWERGRRYVVGIPRTARHFLEGAIDLAEKQGYQRVAIIGEDCLFTTSNARGAEDLARQRGLDVAMYELYQQGTTDFTELLTKIKTLKIDVLLVYAFMAESILITQQIKTLDVNLKICTLAGAALLPEYISALGPLAEYVMSPTPWEPIDLGYPEAKAFIERFKARFGSLPSGHNANAYASLVILEKAIRKAGSFDREAIRNSLFVLEDHNFYGDYKVDERTGEQIGKIMLMCQILNGERRVIWPESVREVAPILSPPDWQSR